MSESLRQNLRQLEGVMRSIVEIAREDDRPYPSVHRTTIEGWADELDAVIIESLPVTQYPSSLPLTKEHINDNTLARIAGNIASSPLGLLWLDNSGDVEPDLYVAHRAVRLARLIIEEIG